MSSGTAALTETCDSLARDLDRVTREVHQAELRTGLLTGDWRASAEHLRGSVEVFLRMARDLRTELASDREFEQRANAVAWADRAIAEGAVDLTGSLRLSSAAHAACLRLLVTSIPGDQLCDVIGPLGSWHAAFRRDAHRNAVESLHSAFPPRGRHRGGDHHRNRILSAQLVPDLSPGQPSEGLPSPVSVVVVRAQRDSVRAMLDDDSRPPWWWTVWRVRGDTLVVVVDSGRAPGSWLDDTLDLLLAGRPVTGVVAAEATIDSRDIGAVLGRLLASAARRRAAPVRRASVLTGTAIDLLDAVDAAPAARSRITRLLSSVHDSAALVRTVEALLENELNLSRAAEEIGLHRSTLTYRLNQITRRSGLDPRTSEGAAAWWLALAARRED